MRSKPKGETIVKGFDIWTEIVPGDMRKVFTVHALADEDLEATKNRATRVTFLNFSRYSTHKGPLTRIVREGCEL